MPSFSLSNVNWAKTRRSVLAGLCGTAAHSLLMFMKNQTGVLPEFQPYDDLQRALSSIAGTSVHPTVTWLLTFVNGALILGTLFGQIYPVLPGRQPWQKGLFFGLCAWAAMGFVFFPLLGRGIFAAKLGLGIAPAVFMLAMMLSYSVTMSLIYRALKSPPSAR